MPRRVFIAASLVLLALGLLGCKIVATKKPDGSESANMIVFGGRKVDSDALAAELWDSRILPYLDRKAGNFLDVKASTAADFNRAGKTYGYREKEEGSPWTMMAKAEGKIVAANTASKAATVAIDADGDGAADLTVQIGPVFKGTALRDALDFISFNQFTNQIEFAQFAKSLNLHADRTVLAALPRDRLIGRQVKVLGAYPLDKADAPVLLTPARLELGTDAMTGNGGPKVVLKIEAMTKVYPGTIALNHVDFEVHAGAVNVLVGENGAGKSTLMKIIAGVERPTHGTMTIDGKPVTLDGPESATAHGIGIVFQELNLFPNLSIAENIFAAREIAAGGIVIDHARQEREAAALLKRLEHPLDPKTLVEDLRIGQQQIVEIAKALAQHARILILDEPTSALSAAEVKILFRIIAELKSQGVAIVYISHRLDELIRIGDTITVLRDGRITGHARVKDIDVAWIVRQMTGSKERDIPKGDGGGERPEAFRAEHISLSRAGGGRAVDDVSLAVKAGEIVGIYGLLGAGRSEFFECLIGRHAHSAGEIFIGGKRIGERDIAGRIGRGLFLIPEDRQREGLISILRPHPI